MLYRIERSIGWRPEFAQIDVRDCAALSELFSAHRFDSAIHFAGLMAVGAPVERPLYNVFTLGLL